MKLLSTVALLRDMPEKKLVRGQVGTIVEELSDSYFEIEFCDAEGQTYAQAPLTEKDVMVLHYDQVAA